ncbi:MAG: multidrug transporter permease [Solirubrobacterales bacterium]|nr:multidrug transporter permease [Solirubrobacterales bacterium]
MSASSAASPAASVDLGGRPPALARPRALRLTDGVAAMAQAELRKLRHDHLDIFTRSVQPLLWLFVFGNALAGRHVIDTKGLDYRAYLAPGVMAQAAMFLAIFFGLVVVWERDVGQLQRLLATPIPRSAIVLGKSAGAAVRALIQAVLLFAILAVAQIDIRWRPIELLGALLMLALGTGAFASLSLLVASVARSRERFMGIGQLIMMPLFFASSALYPISIMPGWLQVVARLNPLTYEVQGLRELMLGTGGHGELWLDFLVIVGFFAAMVAAATKAYPRAIL